MRTLWGGQAACTVGWPSTILLCVRLPGGEATRRAATARDAWLQEAIEKTDAAGKLLPEMVRADTMAQSAEEIAPGPT